MTLDNQSAFVQVGKNVPRIAGTELTAYGQVNNITMENIGLIMGVTPRISPENMVVMELGRGKIRRWSAIRLDPGFRFRRTGREVAFLQRYKSNHHRQRHRR